VIIVQKIKYKNFLACGREFIEISLDTHKSTLFVGTNGAGKSTLLDAISFALFNKPFRDVNKGLVVNTITKKDCVVECELKINGKEYLIRRGIKPNIFQIFIDGTEVPPPATTPDFQAYLEKQILNLNHKSFTQVVMLGSALFVPFMKLKTPQRREVVEDLLDLQVFSHMNVILKDDMKTVATQIDEKHNGLALLQQKISGIEMANKALQSNNADHIAHARKEHVRYNGEIAIQDDDLNRVNKELNTIVPIDLASLRAKVRELADIVSPVRNNIRQAKTDIEFFTTNEVCPECSQGIDHNHKTSIITKKNDRIEELEKASNKLQKMLEAAEQDVGVAEVTEKRILSLTREVRQIELKIKDYEVEINHLNARILELEKPPAQAQDPSKYQMMATELETVLENQLQSQRVMKYAASLLKDGGIKSQVIKQYIPIFNTLINKYLTSLDFFVDFHLDENFNETIRSRHRDTFVYNLFSEGQKMRIDLALMFTWRAIARQRNSIDINILVLDEVFDSSLDDHGTDEFLNLIRKLTSDDNVVVISHKGDKLQDKFERTLSFELVKNFSQMKDIT
jgi:DNA repair exonuclease SbcCD ATPase subunit